VQSKDDLSIACHLMFDEQAIHNGLTTEASAGQGGCTSPVGDGGGVDPLSRCSR
jgi:hypothetical protein